MAHESFEDPDTAALMNALFVNVKVDREERPDLDKIYQVAQQLITQRAGGWPLTMFLTPGGSTAVLRRHVFPEGRELRIAGVQGPFAARRRVLPRHRAEIEAAGRTAAARVRAGPAARADPPARRSIARRSTPRARRSRSGSTPSSAASDKRRNSRTRWPSSARCAIGARPEKRRLPTSRPCSSRR